MKYLLVLCIFQFISRADQTVARFVGNGYAREAYRVDAERFTIVFIEQRAREFVAKYLDAPFARMEMSVDEGARMYGGKGIYGVNEENYFYRLQKLLEHTKAGTDNIASLVKVGPAAVLRIRKNGKVSVMRLTRGYEMPGANAAVEILLVAPLVQMNSVTGVQVFARTTGDVSSDRAFELAESIAKLRPCFDVRVVLRADAYFGTEDLFPFIYPFDTAITHPTREGFRRAKQANGRARHCEPPSRSR